MTDIVDNVAKKEERPKSSRNDGVVKVQKLADSEVSDRRDEDHKRRRKDEPISK